MAYLLSVPVMNRNCTEENRQKLAGLLRQAGAGRVFIAFEREVLYSEDRSADLALLKSNVGFFRACGFETGVWTQAFGFGNPLGGSAAAAAAGFTRIKSICGEEYPGGDAICPTDENFMRLYLSFIRDIARCAPDLIMLDDDLCLSVRPGIGCCCKNHQRLLEEKLGRSVSGKALQQAFSGEGNPVRDAYMQVMGDTLRTFCKRVRAAVDEVDPGIRAGFCAGYTSFDLEGADAAELAAILAGRNRPFLRFTGAPYWLSRSSMRFEGQSLNGVIECVRTQEAFCRGKLQDVFHEADTYPRPRYRVPANYIELFDMA